MKGELWIVIGRSLAVVLFRSRKIIDPRLKGGVSKKNDPGLDQYLALSGDNGMSREIMF